MKFTGSVRAPGDRDPGVRVVLDIDEYHLEIRRDSELFGRFYLADVEVARDIAERFILFLGDDEVEFLADDALQFAYGGVTAMQDAWLEAQKKKRRHRRAAEAAARRKDDEPRPAEIEAPVTSQPLHVSESDAVRRRRLEAGAPTRPIPSPGREAPAARALSSPTPSPDNGNGSRKAKPAAPDRSREIKEPTLRRKSPPVPPRPEPATFKDIVEDELFVDDAIIDQPIHDEAVPHEAVAEPVASEYLDHIDEIEIEDTSLAARRRKISARAQPEPVRDTKREARAKPRAQPETKREAIPEPAPEVVPEPEPDALPEPQPEAILEAPAKGQRQAKPKESDLGRVRLPEPVSAKSAQPAAQVDSTAVAEPASEAKADGSTESASGVRFAQDGHHPFETSTGLLAKLRGQPRRPTNHVHRFKESGSSVGLVRRVCIECAYVSIGSDD